MDERTFKTLELEELVSLLARHVQSPLGRIKALGLQPATDPAEINRGLDRTSECVGYHTAGHAFGFSGVSDPDQPLQQLRVAGTRLGPLQILAFERLIAVGMDLRQEFRDPEAREKYPQLAELTAPVPDLRKLITALRGKILPSGEIDDHASPELRRIRRELTESRARIHRQLESILRGQERAVQEDLVTFRNGRFVIPIRSDARNQVPGVMHGLSSSGQTSFIEPLGVINQNNDLVRLREQEETEIANILFALTELLRENIVGIEAIIRAISEIDFAQAKARLAAEFQCVRPHMTSHPTLRLIDARHILLEHALRPSRGTVVPISYDLDAERQVMVISGPNAGGKTVVLKTTGLIALMAQMGLHVPAHEAILPVFRQVFADIGDQQSIVSNLSTFTAHMRNISDMALSVSPPALVLLDEVGTGTDPDEGAALAVAMVDFFHRLRATTIATTHYNQLKAWASQAPGVLNASVEFDTETLRPTYRLRVGVAGASCGLDIAERMQVPRGILESARLLLDPVHVQAGDYLKRLKTLVDEQETLRAALEQERRITAERFIGLDREFAEREAKRRARFESELAKIIKEFTAESSRLVASLKDRAEAARIKKQGEARAADLRRTASTLVRKHVASLDAEADPGAGETPGAMPSAAKGKRFSAPSGAKSAAKEAQREIRRGDRVRVSSLDQEGIVDSIGDDVCAVRVGAIRLRARRSELELLETPPPQPPAKIRVSVAAGPDLNDEIPAEVNVIGLNTDEASARVDKFIDSAYLAGTESVRIIHGHGTGALRRAIAQLLTGHPQVESFHAAPPNQGGAGATMVELRK